MIDRVLPYDREQQPRVQQHRHRQQQQEQHAKHSASPLDLLLASSCFQPGQQLPIKRIRHTSVQPVLHRPSALSNLHLVASQPMSQPLAFGTQQCATTSQPLHMHYAGSNAISAGSPLMSQQSPYSTQQRASQPLQQMQFTGGDAYSAGSQFMSQQSPFGSQQGASASQQT